MKGCLHISQKGKYQRNPETACFKEKTASYEVPWEVSDFSGMLLPEREPRGLWGLTGMQNALPSQQQQRCLRAWRGSPLYQASCTTGHDPHTCLAGPSPMSPDDPTDVIISGKRLIGQHTMSLPLIKEHSRKTEIATKHCQQSNQQQQLAVSPVLSWALGRKQGWWFREERPERTLLHAEGFCGKSLGLGAEVRWGVQGWTQQFVGWFLCSSKGATIKNPAASCPSS